MIDIDRDMLRIFIINHIAISEAPHEIIILNP
jgi:hypothetical protein